MIRVVLFDAGGTLIRVRGSVGAVYSSIAAAHGVHIDAAAIEASFRAAFRGMPPLCFPDHPVEDLPSLERNWWKTLVRKAFRDVEFADFDAYFDELFEHFANAASWDLFSDVIPALRSLSDRGIRMGVVSNFDGRLERICEGLGLTPFFDTVVMSARAGHAKPDPEAFRVALERLGAPPSEALHVGDSAEEDVRGARRAGLQAVLVDRHRPPMPPGEIDDLRRLIDLL